MDRMTSDTVGQEYDVLCDLRDSIPGILDARLAAAGFGDLTENELLVLAAMNFDRSDARSLIRRLGISSQVGSESVEKMILRGYLDFVDSPDNPRQSALSVTKRGRAAFEECEGALKADRWTDFSFRPGDIVISTEPKSGTTWMQMICALLIFQSPVLPAPLPELSPWIDRLAGRAEIYAELAAQRHRRFIKTHVPLNEIPVDEQVTYIVVARNPLDTALSLHYQDSVLLEGQRKHREPREWLLNHIDSMVTSQRERDSYLGMMLSNLCGAWERRAEPNVALRHYEDLSADLAGEMRRLAELLDITVPDAEWPCLVEAATFEHMRATADRISPLISETKGNASDGYAAFFRRGSSGEGQSLLTDAELDRYYAGAGRIAPREFLAWLHRDIVAGPRDGSMAGT